MDAEHGATFLLVGCGHWGNPGLDIRQVKFDDMLAPRRQEEIADCVERLARFEPTKVALEIEANQVPAFNDDYRRWRNGTFDLTANERHQLGFRIAGAMGHDHVHGFDWHDHSRTIGWERAIDHAMDHGQRHLLGSIADVLEDTTSIAARDAEEVAAASVLTQLLETNSADGLVGSHRVYLDMARIGDVDTHIGADVVIRWYERNMKMFVNLTRLVESPGERVLVVVGGGHLPLLRHFLEGAGYAVEPVERYLGKRSVPEERQVTLRGLQPGDVGWVASRNGALYAEQFGWDTSFEALVAGVLSDYHRNFKPGRENGWIAEVNSERAGCVFCCQRDDTTAQLRILLVEPWARGVGLGRHLVDECIAFARGAGYSRMMLWTVDTLTSARRIYAATGFELVSSEPVEQFGFRMMDEIWELDLMSSASG